MIIDDIHGKIFDKYTCQLLFGDSTNLLDEILSHPLSIDYFNVYLSLPIFGQRVLCHRVIHQFEFDPPLLTKHQASDQLYKEAKEWLINYRLDNYIHTDIYIESLLALLLTKADDTSIRSKEVENGERSDIFSTVTDVRQFYQFLQSTSGIKYWNFFIDSMHLLRSRCTSRSNRIDISHLNFIHKYYSQQHEFRSITADLNNSSMPDSSTPDAIWFQMAINAMQQLRIYWLPRYIGQLPSVPRSKIKHPTMKSNSNKIHGDDVKPPSENIILKDHLPNINSMIKEPKFIKFTLGNMSYIDYNPRQYIPIQPSVQHDFQEDIEELNEPNKNNNNQSDIDYKISFDVTSFPSSDRSIEDYATDANIELFYRIFISDFLAGYPFFEYISQTIPKNDVIAHQTCIHFITDAEILFSIPSGKFKDRILKQFISQYFDVTPTDQLPNQIFDNIEEERIELIQELMIEDNNQYSLLWKLLLKVTKFLIPHFLNYIKFDRLRFLVQVNYILHDLRHYFPSVNFETLLSKETDSKQGNSNETETFLRTNLINCGELQDNLLESTIKNQFYTTEKLINTDEKCEFRIGERFPPLTDTELEQELRQFDTKSEPNDVETILDKSFETPINLTTFIGNPLKTNEHSEIDSIETFTLEIMNSAREIFEIDRFISNLMDDSLHLVQTNDSLGSTKSDLSSSPLSPVFEEILLTDSSLTTTLPKLITNDTNKNAFVSSDIETNSTEKEDITFRKAIKRKILSLIGSYFINSPTQLSDFPKPKQINEKVNFFHETIKFAPKDQSNEVKNTIIEKPITYCRNANKLKFIQNEINNHQWPLQEYIGIKGQRSWRALKLAADISNLDDGFMLNYHNDFDWISTDKNLGSFSERTSLIIRNFQRRIEQQKVKSSY